jgi:hypothetical protein
MGGGLLQLVAYGAQDVYLTGNPQITFFKVVYRRHTNFAMESIENVFNGSAGFGKRVTAQISRNGDLINRMYVQVQLPAVTSGKWCDYVGLRVLQDVEIEIGGQRIDKHYAHWMYIWNELSLPVGKRGGYDKMVGQTLGANPALSNLFVPLEFWFNRNVGLALPLIALQYHEVKINIDFETSANCLAYGSIVSGTDIVKASIWVDYIYLDTDERRRFAQLSHEYLIEQLQFTGDESINGATNRIKMNFNHPVKELVWVVQADSRLGGGAASNNWVCFTSDGTNNSANYGITVPNVTSTSASRIGVTNYVDESPSTNIQLNGQDRFYAREGSYFNLVQPYQHHENVSGNCGINVYSFALKPEEHQPSGTLNFSRIDTAVLNLKTTQVTTGATAKVKVFAVNYNVLRIMSGMGGLAYSN